MEPQAVKANAPAASKPTPRARAAARRDMTDADSEPRGKKEGMM